MAQAVFQEHPLEDYLRDAGETPEIMPGGSLDFESPEESDEDADSLANLLPDTVMQVLEIVRSIIIRTRSSCKQSPFGERFKYDVISSTLLSASISSSHSPHSRTSSLPIPGRLKGHSPMSSSDGHSDTEHDPSSTRTYPPPPTTELESWLESAAFALAAVTIGFGYYFLSLLIVGGTFYYMHITSMEAVSKSDVMKSTLDSLNDLITAGNIWDSVVHESITILENDERSIFYGPNTPTSPASSLRVALQSSLHTTQTQCDNIRHLFSALTAPSELSQLSEMYAPPSPVYHGFTAPFSPSSSRFPDNTQRPLSHPGSPLRTTSTSLSSPSPVNKRSTWNGSYATLASAGSPTSTHLLNRRAKRRSDLSSLLGSSSGLAVSPKKRSGSMGAADMSGLLPLPGLQEEDIQIPVPLGQESDGEIEVDQPHFGAAALDLQRQRKAAVFDVFASAPTSASPRNGRSSPSTVPMSTASRFTTMQTTRHPLSLSALHNAVQGAVASKRYACAHLLALRFNEDDADEAYWENVRSVMGLLTSTFVDASSRLTEALEDLDKTKLQDQIPSPLPRSATSSDGEESHHHHDRLLSFAPMPSHLARFAAHVDVISTALNDARDHLEECVASIRNDSLHPEGLHQPSSSSYPSPPAALPLQDTPALRAYERLRRELGLALRECERGRERLLDIVAPRRHHVPDEECTDGEDLPGLGHDHGSDESDKPDEAVSPIFGNNEDGNIGVSVVGPDTADDIDDATSHLLLATSSQHLPPPGIEQVFEAETGEEGSFVREKSKLSREERIRLMKARREGGGGLGLGLHEDLVPRKPAMEMWGPGGEVVQELKDVIWKVGERRRKMAENQAQAAAPVPTHPDTTAMADTPS